MTFSELLSRARIIPRMQQIYRHSFRLDPQEDAAYFAIVEPLLSQPGIQNLDRYIQHSDITTLRHVISVSYIAYRVCRRLSWDYKSAARAGILHDYVTYDWHVSDPSHRLHGFRHPGFALTNSRAITELSPVEENCIIRHMWPLTPIPPKYKEAMVLTLVDKFCATKETMRKYQSRPEEY